MWVVPIVSAGITADKCAKYRAVMIVKLPRGQRDRSENAVIAGIPGNYWDLPGSMKPSFAMLIYCFHIQNMLCRKCNVSFVIGFDKQT